ncbi:MAG: MATE family efflux transporter, partial [Myxococcales bacterium]|nr:MATE family efflux transporter [Myxococcales bacterium]
LGNIVDRSMLGWLDGGADAARVLAAAAYATQFFFLVQSALLAVGFACVAAMSRAIGAGAPARARAAFAASLQVGLLVAGLFMAFFFAVARPALPVLFGAAPEVVELTLPYLYCLLSSSFMLTFCLVVDSALRSNRDTLTPMRVAAGISVVKLGGNAILIFGLLGAPKLGLTGAGVASLLSQSVGVALFAFALARQPSDSPVRLRRADWTRASALRRTVARIALPGIVERLVMTLSQTVYFSVLSHAFGTVAVAAYAIGVPLLSLTWIPGTGYAQACSTLVGQALGARDPARAMATGLASARLAVATAIAVGLPVFLLRDVYASWFTGDASVVAQLGPFLMVLALTQPFLQLHFTLAGAHRGAGDTLTPLVAATTSNVLRFALAWVSAIWLELPILYVWLAIFVDHAVRAAVLWTTFRRGRWLAVEPERARA